MRLKWIIIISVILLIVGFGLGYGLGQRMAGSEHSHDQGPPVAAEGEVQWYYCSMHPQIRKTEPAGKCDICGMDLIPMPKAPADDDLGPRELRLSSRAQKLAQIQTAPVERKFVTAEIRMAGKIAFDETRLAYITAWVPGRIDRLFADFTGISVRRGDHMVQLYSPELLTTQQELIQALDTVKKTRQSALASMRQTAEQTVTAARERLRLWGLNPQQIEEIERRGTPADHMTIYAPISGIVVDKHLLEGAYVDTGTRIYTIADLSQVWIKLDAYESDLALIRYGQQVKFQTESCPGEVFAGKITFIHPVLDARTRTVKVRVNAANPQGKLKPEMFVRGVVHSQITEGGGITEPNLAGKWISPMHPEIVKDGPGTCDICGMPLVPAETLGYAAADAAPPQAPLVVPVSAPLITGKRAIVYVEAPAEKGRYQGKDVILGPRAGDYYIVKKGLKAGEQVVVNGNFKVDSAIQLLGKTSMMNPPQAEPAKISFERLEIPAEFKVRLAGIFTAYLNLQYLLSHDNFTDLPDAVKKLSSALSLIDMGLLQEQTTHQAWMEEQTKLKKIIADIAGAKDIEKAREIFEPLSETFLALVDKFGNPTKDALWRIHCPMAFNNRGADWLQNKAEVENPYFGSAMFNCGSEVEIFTPDSMR